MDSCVVTATQAPLLAFQCQERKSFKAVGLDFMGPLRPLLDTGQKTYILVLTCTYTCAVNIWPIQSKSGPAFVAAFNTVPHEYGIKTCQNL